MKTSRRILKNLFSLTVAEAASKGIALIWKAYLARIILVEGFGIIGFANALLVYFLLIVNLGFNTVGAREAAKNLTRIKLYVNSILTARSLLSVIAYSGLAITVFFLNKPLEVKYVVLLAGINLFSNAILLDWLYQGIEKMEVLAIRQFITGLLNLAGVLILVNDESDVIIAMGINVAAIFINSAWMVAYYIKLYGPIKFSLKKDLLKELLKSSIPVTFSNFFITVLNTFSIVLLGLLRSEKEAGFYNAGYNIIILTMTPSAIIQNAFFPVLSRASSAADRIRVAEKYSLLIYLVGVYVSGIIFTYSDFFIIAIYGDGFAGSIDLLKILMVTSLLGFVNTSLTPPLIAWNKEKFVMYVIMIAGSVSIILNFILITYMGYIGAGIVTNISESVVFIGLAYLFFKTVKKLFLLNLVKFLIFIGIACGTGYYLTLLGMPDILGIIISSLIYYALIFGFKMITVSEIKGYFAK